MCMSAMALKDYVNQEICINIIEASNLGREGQWLSKD